MSKFYATYGRCLKNMSKGCSGTKTVYLTWQAAFIPSLDNAQDTSYFSSRFTWNSNDSHFMNDIPYDNSSDDESTCSGSSSDFDEAVRLT
jgi:hypothetical protein